MLSQIVIFVCVGRYSIQTLRGYLHNEVMEMPDEVLCIVLLFCYLPSFMGLALILSLQYLFVVLFVPNRIVSI